ncbi:MAG TPA: hypothetical protein VF043_04580 [Ktedonobacteraceae bacterium]
MTDDVIIVGDAGHDWGYMSEPAHVGHPIPVKRGKVLGGSSKLSFFPDGLRAAD